MNGAGSVCGLDPVHGISPWAQSSTELIQCMGPCHLATGLGHLVAVIDQVDPCCAEVYIGEVDDQLILTGHYREWVGG